MTRPGLGEGRSRRRSFEVDADLRVEVRRTSRPVSGLNVIVGAWLVVAPALLNYTADDAASVSVVIGIAVIVVGLVRTIDDTAPEALSAANAVLGAMLIASSVVAANSTQAIWNETLSGAAIILVGVLSVAAGPSGEEGRAPLSRASRGRSRGTFRGRGGSRRSSAR